MKQYSEIAKNILIAAGIAGGIVVVAAAPGILLAAKLFDEKIFEQDYTKFSKKTDQKKAARTLQRLQRHKLITIKRKNEQFVIRLTKEGRKLVGDIQLHNLQLTKPPQWDHKWRIVIFDIPDKSSRRGRDALREKLKEWEFYQLQKSVWVCPWPCENEIWVIADLYNISPHVNIAVAEKIVKNSILRKHFKL